MKIRKHFFVNDHCIHCGALSFPRIQKQFSDRGQTVPQTDERTCVERDDHFYPHELRPEPQERRYACHDTDFIKERLDALRAEQKPVEQPAAEQQQSSSDWGIYWGELKIRIPKVFTISYQSQYDKLLHLSEKSIG